jgi:glycosyltransferase involved in cell wall biosynthesis
MMKPMISVVTITFNNYEELTKTLESLPSGSNIESIVVNGGSCIKTAHFLATYKGKVVTEKDHGISDAFNKGARLATGEGIAFLNSGDELIEKDYYDRVSGAFEASPRSSYVYADLLFEDTIAGKMTFRSTKPSLADIGKGMPFPHPTLVVRKSVFQEVGEFNLQYRIGMDFEWVIRLIKLKHTGTHLISTPVLMDGTGVSSVNQERSLQECARALSEQNLFSGKIAKDHSRRVLKYKIREFIRKTFGNQALKAIKQLKNR